jgi:hypothetical protein
VDCVSCVSLCVRNDCAVLVRELMIPKAMAEKLVSGHKDQFIYVSTE